MKTKLLKSMRMLLVAAGLLVGASASWADDWTTLQTLDFETESTISDGWAIVGGSNTRSQITHGSGHGLLVRADTGGSRDYYYGFTNSDFTSADQWKMEFDFAGQTANSAATHFYIYKSASGSSYGQFTSIDKLFNITDGGAYTTSGKVYPANDTGSSLATITFVNYLNNGYSITDESWYHITVIGNKDDNYVNLAITDASGNSVLSATKVCNFVNPAGMAIRAGKGIGAVALDDVTFSIVSDNVLDPSAEITTVSGTSRTVMMSQTQDADIYYYECEDDNYDTDGLTPTQYTTPLNISETKYYAIYATNGSKNSNTVNYTFEAGTTVYLASASVSLASVTNNYDTYLTSPIFTISNPNNSDVLLRPSTETLSYTFTPEGGSESAPTVIASGATYTPTEKGTLTVYAAATGYGTSSYTIPVSNYYSVSYTTDFTAYDSNPFGESYSDVTSSWWTTAYRSTASNNTTLGRVRFGNNTVTDLVIGYGIGRAGSNCASNKIRYAKKGNIEVLTINNTNSSGVNSGTYYTNILETSGTGATQQELSGEFSISSYNTLKVHTCYTPDVYPATASATVTSAGWATLYTPYALDFSSLSEDLAAYTATCSESTVTLTKVSTVPAGTGVVLKGAADTYSIPVIASSETVKGDLKGSATEATAYDAVTGYDLYMLALNDNNEAQFTLVNDGSIAAGKAYLQVAKGVGGARALNVVFAGDATGIQSIDNGQLIIDNAVYNLNGQRVSKPKKGLYIVNGTKILVNDKR